jgi:hypothetical protein
VNLAELLQAIADAIREKSGKITPINAQHFSEEILNLDTDSKIQYNQVLYNEDTNKIIFIDDTGSVYEMDCVYEDGKIVKIGYNNEELNINYEGNNLKLVEDTEIDLSMAQVDNRGIEYKNIIYNDNKKTITLTDTDDFIHKLSYVYEDNKLMSIFYGNKEIKLGYNDNDDLVLVGKTNVDLTKVIIDNSSIDYDQITYKEDNTGELIDKDGVSHSMAFEYKGEKINTVFFDGMKIPLEYNEDSLELMGKTKINLKKAKISSGEKTSTGACYPIKIILDPPEVVFKESV